MGAPLHAVERWRASFGARPSDPGLHVLGADREVLLVARGDATIALDLATGAPRWTQARREPLLATLFGDAALIVSTRRLATPRIDAAGVAWLYELGAQVVGRADGRGVIDVPLPDALQRLRHLAVEGEGPSATLWVLADGARRRTLGGRRLAAAAAAWSLHDVPPEMGEPVPCARGLVCMVEGAGIERLTAEGPVRVMDLPVRVLRPILGTGDLLAVVAHPDDAQGCALVRIDGERFTVAWRAALPWPAAVPGERVLATSPAALAHPDGEAGGVTVRDARSGAVRWRAASGVHLIQQLALVEGGLLVSGLDARGRSVFVVLDASTGAARFAARGPAPLRALGDDALLFQVPGAPALVAAALRAGTGATWRWDSRLAAVLKPWSRPLALVLAAHAGWSTRALHLFACAVATRVLDASAAAAGAPRRQVSACEAAIDARRSWALGALPDAPHRRALAALARTGAAAGATVAEHARQRRRAGEAAAEAAEAWEAVVAQVQHLLAAEPLAAAAAADRTALAPGALLALLVRAHGEAGVGVPDALAAALAVELDQLEPDAHPAPAWLRELDPALLPALAARLRAVPPAEDAAAAEPRAAHVAAPLAAWARAALEGARAANLVDLADDRLEEAVQAVAGALAEAEGAAEGLRTIAALLLEADFVDEVYASDAELIRFLSRIAPAS